MDNNVKNEEMKYRFPIILHVLLWIVTFGIWGYVWTYRMTRCTNCAYGEKQRSPIAQLLLCMFVPFYNIYWSYKTAKRIDKIAIYKNVISDIGILCLFLSFIWGHFFASIAMQLKLNQIVDEGEEECEWQTEREEMSKDFGSYANVEEDETLDLLTSCVEATQATSWSDSLNRYTEEEE